MEAVQMPFTSIQY